MTLANAFTTAWKDLKTGAAKVAEFLTKNQTTITAVSEVGAVVSVIDPALAPAATVFDQLEEQVVGKVLELRTVRRTQTRSPRSSARRGR